jgi:hypothetical protein
MCRQPSWWVMMWPPARAAVLLRPSMLTARHSCGWTGGQAGRQVGQARCWSYCSLSICTTARVRQSTVAMLHSCGGI